MTGVSECSQQRGNLKDDRYSQNPYLNSGYILRAFTERLLPELVSDEEINRC
ncbi:hypothetical protein [Photorhabdus bodei]|uniref:Uncharacterized protein n=1 Tax=Photorhabdus bodei TaxID=2029681 RepID=A0ABX0AJB1_9GAMM|nr:hypothetical protein [Photorhabdus bodei]NDK97672.1 hypothetical protein [Photorhabdus bodei]NDL01921.1 hypothetical protein [Photorhabdus bodei]NDL05995.1 hypothetical protein [Photorhabdus bodei]